MPPKILFGTAALGILDDQTDDPETLIYTALQTNSFCGFDTSPHYGDAESILGDVLQSSYIRKLVSRSDYMLTSKGGREGSYVDWSINTIRDSLTQSLKKLKTEYLDAYFLHDLEYGNEAQWQKELIPTLQYLAHKRKQGVVRQIGLSCHPIETIVTLFKCLPEIRSYIDVIFCYGHNTILNTLEHDADHILTSPNPLEALYTQGIPDHVRMVDGAPYAMGLLRGYKKPLHPFARTPFFVKQSGDQWPHYLHKWDTHLRIHHKRSLPEMAIDYTVSRTNAEAVVVGIQSVRELNMVDRAWNDVQMREWEML